MRLCYTLLVVTFFIGTASPMRVFADNLATTTSEHEPPTNPFAADSPWPMSHRGPYGQASSPYAGPTSADQASPQFIPGAAVPISLAISSPYSNGQRVIWGNTLKYVFKANVSSSPIEYIDRVNRPQSRHEAVSGAYVVLDRNGTYFSPRGLAIEAYGDEFPSDVSSSIREIGKFTVPEKWQGNNDALVGMTLTYDGWLCFATRRGVVGCVSRDLRDAHYLRLPQDASDPIEVSNSIAVDETGGIFITTDRTVDRVQWRQGQGLKLSWSVAYQTNGKVAPGRLGKGSGTTPSLMGVGSQDKFVVIGDGQSLMHIVMLWRDEIPRDWVGLPDRNRRIAAEVPATFGDPNAKHSVTEQSLTVRGYDVATVSNRYGKISPLLRRVAQKRMGGNVGLATVYRSNQPNIAPYGVEKFSWNPTTRKLTSIWANPKLSIPNGIPSMSEATGLLYGIGQRNGFWTLEGIDWKTGQSVFHRQINERGSKYNSFYAATEVGLDGSILSGSFGGLLRFGGPHSPRITTAVEFKELGNAGSTTPIAIVDSLPEAD